MVSSTGFPAWTRITTLRGATMASTKSLIVWYPVRGKFPSATARATVWSTCSRIWKIEAIHRENIPFRDFCYIQQLWIREMPCSGRNSAPWLQVHKLQYRSFLQPGCLGLQDLFYKVLLLIIALRYFIASKHAQRTGETFQFNTSKALHDTCFSIDGPPDLCIERRTNVLYGWEYEDICFHSKPFRLLEVANQYSVRTKSFWSIEI